MTSLADIVLAFHFGIALFITLGLLLIPLGFIYSWSWIRNRRCWQNHPLVVLPIKRLVQWNALSRTTL